MDQEGKEEMVLVAKDSPAVIMRPGDVVEFLYTHVNAMGLQFIIKGNQELTKDTGSSLSSVHKLMRLCWLGLLGDIGFLHQTPTGSTPHRHLKVSLVGRL